MKITILGKPHPATATHPSWQDVKIDGQLYRIDPDIDVTALRYCIRHLDPSRLEYSQSSMKKMLSAKGLLLWGETIDGHNVIMVDRKERSEAWPGNRKEWGEK
jgi:hypothetical protein